MAAMHPVAAILILSCWLFAATNLDDLLVLVAFYASPAYSNLQIVAGHYLGMAVLFGVGLAFSLLKVALPAGAVGWLGLIPIAIGAKKLWELRRNLAPAAAEPGRPKPGLARPLVVAAVCLSNGGDNLAVYSSQFALRSGGDVAVMGLAFAALTGLWCLLAAGILTHPALGRAVRVNGHRWMPWGLIALGLWTLHGAGVI
jgi:cadmium resistance protein CadD (predicted permease)